MKDKYLLAVNKERDKDGAYAKRASKAFERLGAGFILERDIFNNDLGKYADEIKASVVLGGDGTLMRVADSLKCHGIPILGINIGNLGYLTGAEGDELEDAIERLVTGKYTIEKRMMLDVSVNDGPSKAFLNDAVITRNGYSRMIQVALYVNGKQLYTLFGDGVIVSTPTGSTGYNLSAGGMICVPEAEMTMVMPICPHSMAAQGFIAAATDVIEAELLPGRNGAETETGVTIDGNTFIPLKAGDRVKVTKSESVTRLIKIHDNSFFDIVRAKLV